MFVHDFLTVWVCHWGRGVRAEPVCVTGQRQKVLLQLRSTLPTVFTIGGRGGGVGHRHRGTACWWWTPSCRTRRCSRSRPTHAVRILSPPRCWCWVLMEDSLCRATALPPRWWRRRQVCSHSPLGERCPGECDFWDRCLCQRWMRMLVQKCWARQLLWSVVFCDRVVCVLLCFFAWYAPWVKKWYGLVRKRLVRVMCRCSSSQRHNAG